MVKVCASGVKWQENLDKKPWLPHYTGWVGYEPTPLHSQSRGMMGTGRGGGGSD